MDGAKEKIGDRLAGAGPCGEGEKGFVIGEGEGERFVEGGRSAAFRVRKRVE